MSLLSLPLAKVLGETGDELFRGNLKRLADAQECEHGERAAGLDHLPMAHAEVVGIHIFLGEFAFDAPQPNSVAQGAEEAGIVSWEVSAGGHPLRLPTHEQKHHEQGYVF
jgi:hypothetical protein